LVGLGREHPSLGVGASSPTTAQQGLQTAKFPVSRRIAAGAFATIFPAPFETTIAQSQDLKPICDRSDAPNFRPHAGLRGIERALAAHSLRRRAKLSHGQGTPMFRLRHAGPWVSNWLATEVKIVRARSGLLHPPAECRADYALAHAPPWVDPRGGYLSQINRLRRCAALERAQPSRSVEDQRSAIPRRQSHRHLTVLISA
jgi:hypothetical protein